jgi:hypothetical protein
LYVQKKWEQTNFFIACFSTLYNEQHSCTIAPSPVT